MATLQELLQNASPDQLKRLLEGGSSSMNVPNPITDQTQANAISNSNPVDPNNLDNGPVTTPPVVPPMQFNGSGPFANPQQYAKVLTTMGPPKSLAAPQEPQMDTELPKVKEELEEEGDPSEVAKLFTKKAKDEAEEAYRNPANEGKQEKTEGFTQNTVANLKKIQDEVNDEKQKNQAFKNLNLFATGVAGGNAAALKANNEPFETADKDAEQKLIDYKEQVAKEGDDPKSKVSVDAANFASQMLKKAGFDPRLSSGMSYNQIEKNFPQITKMLDVQTAIESKKLIAEQNALAREQAARDKKENKTSNDQDKAMLQTGQLLESARGNPAAAQAERDIYAADKAKSLANLYGDPNKLSPQMVQLLASEVAKIAAGGSPTMHELEGLNPQTLQNRFAGTWQKIVNNPTPANAAAFVKQYEDYGNALTKDAQKVIEEKYGRVIESRKKQLGDENYDALQNQYINRFKKDANISDNSKPNADQEIVQAPNGKKYLVDHNTKKVIKEVE